MERYLCEAVVPSDTSRAKHLIDAVLNIASAHEFGEHDTFGIHLSLEEALMNAMKHGNRLDVTKYVTLVCIVSEGMMVIRISDEGTGFNPDEVADCLAEENIDKPNGRGLKLIQHFMSEVRWNEAGNEIEMRKSKAA